MKVLHCLAQLPTRTGSGVYYANLISEINQRTDWYQTGLYGLNKKHQVIDLALDANFPVQFETDDLPFPIAGMSDDMPYKSTIYHQMTPVMLEQWHDAFRSRLLEIKRDQPPDIIICHHLWLLSRLVLDIFPDTPVIGVCHATDLRQAQRHPELAKQVGSLNELQAVLALSGHDAHEISQLFAVSPDKIMVTGGAYDPQVFHPSSEPKASDKPIRLLYAGKIVDSKGVFELVSAYAKLRQVVPNMRLDIVGRESDETRARIDQLSNHDPTIKLFDVESQKKLAEHMRKCDLFVFPSYYEGLGLIALEALASGLHLVSNRLPGLVEQLGEDLGRHPVISWLEMPEIENLDQLVDSARLDYVDRLSQAMLEQVHLISSRTQDENFPHQEIHRHSWTSLAKRIIELCHSVTTQE